jgi:GT2 family glycosyltransferase
MGIRAAAGEILAFTDDDCVAPPDWLAHIRSLLEREGADAAGGDAVEGSGALIAGVYQRMSGFFFREQNRIAGKAVYVTTNNFACRASVAREAGAFDERFVLGGSDREFAERLVRAGRRVVHDPTLLVTHRHPFTLRGYLRHLYRQGKGSRVYGRIARERRAAAPRLGPMGYARMLLDVAAAGPWWQSPIRAGLAVLGQVSILAGYVSGPPVH